LNALAKTEEEFLLLERLSSEGDPLALLDLSVSYSSVEGFTFKIKTNYAKFGKK
jgi:hypothetical protein